MQAELDTAANRHLLDECGGQKEGNGGSVTIRPIGVQVIARKGPLSRTHRAYVREINRH